MHGVPLTNWVEGGGGGLRNGKKHVNLKVHAT
jgi:hypothetical protein